MALAAGFAGGAVLRPGQDSVQQEVAVLRETAQGTVRVGAQPDAQQVALTATAAAAGAEGTVLFSGSSGELVMVATGLAAPPAGMEYGCWLETGGERRRIGKMYPGGELQSWVGPVDGLEGLPGGLDVRGLADADRWRVRRDGADGPGLGPEVPDRLLGAGLVRRRAVGGSVGAAGVVVAAGMVPGRSASSSRRVAGSTSVSGGGNEQVASVRAQHQLGALGVEPRDVHRPRDPASLRLELAVADLALPPLGLRDDQPRQGGPDHDAHEDEPPVEVGAHAATGVRRAGVAGTRARIAESGGGRARATLRRCPRSWPPSC